MAKMISVRGSVEDEAGHSDGAYNLIGIWGPAAFAAELQRTLAGEWGLCHADGVVSLRLQIVSITDTFRTDDGYTLFYMEGGIWVDSKVPETCDLLFYADSDGWPIEEDGERLEGKYIDG